MVELFLTPKLLTFTGWKRRSRASHGTARARLRSLSQGIFPWYHFEFT